MPAHGDRVVTSMVSIVGKDLIKVQPSRFIWLEDMLNNMHPSNGWFIFMEFIKKWLKAKGVELV
jgi:hypothetical protein